VHPAMAKASTSEDKLEEKFHQLLQYIFEWQDSDPQHEVVEALLHDNIKSWKLFRLCPPNVLDSLTKKDGHENRIPISIFARTRLGFIHQMVRSKVAADEPHARDITSYSFDEVDDYIEAQQNISHTVVCEDGNAGPTVPHPISRATEETRSDEMTSTKKERKKPRYSKAQKRELKQQKLEQEEEQKRQHEAEKKLRKAEKRKQNEATTQEKRPKIVQKAEAEKKKTNSNPPEDDIDRLLRCAEKALFTDSIVVENRNEFMYDSSDDGKHGDTTNDENQNREITTATTNNAIEKKLVIEIVSVCDVTKQDESTSSETVAEPTQLPLSSLGHRLLTRTTTIKVQPLLVLDLNGILCHRDRQHKRAEFWENLHAQYNNKHDTTMQPPARPWMLRPSIGNLASSNIIPRTDLLEFLSYLDKHFCLAIWTSAKSKTAKYLLNLLLSGGDRRGGYNQINDHRGIRSRFLFVWGQDHCTPVQGSEAKRTKEISNNNKGPSDSTTTMKQDKDRDARSFDDNVVFEKHLSKIWEAYPLWSANNTLLIDDSPDKCPFEAGNAVHPPPLHGRHPPPLSARPPQRTSYRWRDRPFGSHQRFDRQMQQSAPPLIPTYQDKWRNHQSGSHKRFDSPISGGDPPSIPTDEDNADLQALFFRKLVQFWNQYPHIAPQRVVVATKKGAATIDDNRRENDHDDKEGETRKAVFANKRYYHFLQANARGHMGWRGV